jgi:hypothetical protein
LWGGAPNSGSSENTCLHLLIVSGVVHFGVVLLLNKVLTKVN